MKISLLILAYAIALSAQDFTEIRVEKVSGGYQFLEGPVWSKEGGYLLFSDVPASKVLKIDSEGIKTFRAPSGKTNGNTIDPQGRVLSCESEGRRVVRQDKKGNWEVLADKWEGKRLNAPNDIVVRKDGHIYFTDPAFGNQADTRELDFYGVYHIPPKGPMELVAKPKGRPNGLAFSPKGIRLGRGQGYYDRVLSRTKAFRIGLGATACESHGRAHIQNQNHRSRSLRIKPATSQDFFPPSGFLP